MGRRPVPKEEQRVNPGRVSRETFEYLRSLGEPNTGRAIDKVCELLQERNRKREAKKK